MSGLAVASNCAESHLGQKRGEVYLTSFLFPSRGVSYKAQGVHVGRLQGPKGTLDLEKATAAPKGDDLVGTTSNPGAYLFDNGKSVVSQIGDIRQPGKAEGQANKGAAVFALAHQRAIDLKRIFI